MEQESKHPLSLVNCQEKNAGKELNGTCPLPLGRTKESDLERRSTSCKLEALAEEEGYVTTGSSIA